MLEYLSLIQFLHPSLSPVAVLLKDDYFVRGAGLPGRFKAEKMEFHWGQSNGSAGSEHSINGRRFPVEVKRHVATHSLTNVQGSVLKVSTESLVRCSNRL